MKYFIIIFLVLLTHIGYSQGIFKRIPKPSQQMLSKAQSLAATPVTITAWRLTGPIAGFMYPQNQVVTGLGYGYQRLHWVDSTQRYYTNYSISFVAYAGGNVTPSINPNNIISIGISAGFINQLLMIGPAWNLPRDNKKGSAGVIFNVSMPLN